MKAKNNILINSEDIKNYDTKLNEIIKSTVKAVLKAEEFDKKTEISVLIVNSDEIRKLNLKYRGKDTPTDVLSFLSNEEEFEVEPDTNRVILGDIVLCIDVAKKQAEAIGNTLAEEIRFLTIHSMLHLLFYDHETSKEDEEEMFARQQQILGMIKDEIK